jgi:isopenicillin-N epimerase
MTSPTALILPIAELISRARAAGIITVVDGAHAPGQIPLDLHALGADFYVGNCHKWMMSPKGAGFLYARREVQPLLQPLIVSWGAERQGASGSAFIDEHEFQGTRDVAACLTVPEAIRFMERHQWPQVRHRCHHLLRDAAEQIIELTGLTPLAPLTAEWHAQMCSLPLPPCDALRLKQRLYDEYAIEVPIVTWQGRQFVRISIQGYNRQADVDALVRALRVLIPQVAHAPQPAVSPAVR